MNARISILLLSLGWCSTTSAATPEVSLGDRAVTEGAGRAVTARVPVTRTGDVGENLGLLFETADSADQPATAGVDYRAVTAGTAAVPAGANLGSVPVRILSDTKVEPSEHVVVRLRGATNAGPSPSFDDAVDLAPGVTVLDVTTADVNGDGRRDLVTTAPGTNQVLVQLNTTTPGATDPSYAGAVAFAVGPSPNPVAVLDVNGDGRPDVVAANNGSNTVSVLLNTTTAGATTPSFSAATNFVVEATPVFVAVGDLNGDGRLDLAVTNSSSGNLTILLNTTAAGASTAAFSAAASVPTGGGWTSTVAIGDVNGDGIPDLAGVNRVSGNVDIALNATTPGASSPTIGAPQPFAFDNPLFAALRDVNGDGRPDLVATNSFSETISVRINTTVPGGTPSFADEAAFPVGGNPGYLLLDDVNADGRADVAVTNQTTGGVSVLVNTTVPGASAAGFAPAIGLADSGTPSSLTLADLNGDGRPDLVVASNSVHLTARLNTTVSGTVSPSFATAKTYPIHSGASSFATGDLNGDGRMDLAATMPNVDEVAILVNTTPTGVAGSSFADPVNVPAVDGAQRVTLGDLNGDGRMDLVIANYSGSFNLVSVLLNTTTPGAATPSFAGRVDFAVASLGADVAVGDVNGDGRLDLLVPGYAINKVSVLLNTTTAGATTPTFATKVDFSTGFQPNSVALADINGDGRVDMAITNYTGDSLSVFLNTTATGATTPVFAAKVDFPATDPSAVSLADVNGDGRPDLIVTSEGSVAIVRLNTTPLNGSTPSFEAGVNFTTGSVPVNLGVADLNGDGRPDLAMTILTGQGLSILLNTTAAGAGTPSFATKVDYGLTVSGPAQGLALGDVNGDGHPDLFAGSVNQNKFAVLLNQLYGASIGTDEATLTIRDRTNLTISDVGRLEGNAGSTQFVFKVRSSRPLAKAMSVDFATADGTALVSDGDYVPASGTLHFAAGEKLKTIVVQVAGDAKFEPDEKFTVVLSNATLDTLIADARGEGTIRNEDAVPTVSFATASGTTEEGAGVVNLTVRLSNPSYRTVTVPFDTTGTASRSDLSLNRSPWIIPAGQTQKTFAITVTDDDKGEGVETAVLTLGAPTNATLGTLSTFTLTIIDNDGCANVTPTNGCTVNGTPNVACVGTPGADVIVAQPDGHSVIVGDEGGDDITGGSGADLICGGGGNDVLHGGGGPDTLMGQQGNDHLFGDDGDDSLDGGFGTDTVDGGAGTDACEAESVVGCSP